MLGHHHFAIDTTQFTFKGTSLLTLGMGVVVAIFSLVGFESSTAFGEEAVNPLKTIPRSIIWSLVITGAFFIFVSYTEVLGTRGYKDTLDKIDAPLNVLAQMYDVPFLWPLLSAGAMFSFFALASSCMNAGARVMFAMGRHDFFPQNHQLRACEARHAARGAGRHGHRDVLRGDRSATSCWSIMAWRCWTNSTTPARWAHLVLLARTP